MRKLGLIAGIIPTIGYAIKDMGHLSIENAIADVIILWFSLEFIKNLWNFVDKKLKK